mgnify:CR=1 FL=1
MFQSIIQYMRKETINQDDDREPTLALDIINADNLYELVKACIKQGIVSDGQKK